MKASVRSQVERHLSREYKWNNITVCEYKIVMTPRFLLPPPAASASPLYAAFWLKYRPAPHEIVQETSSRQPSMSSSSPAPGPPRPPLPASSAVASSEPTVKHANPPSQAGAPQIDDALARDYPEAASLGKDDLQRLLEDPAYFDAYFSTLDRARSCHTALASKLQANIDLAQDSEELKPALQHLRHDTARLFHEAQDLLHTQWPLLEHAQHEAYRRFSESAQLARYRAATTTQEHLSDALVHAFLNGDGDDESFVRQYREVRKLFHRREIGLHKWDEGKVVWM